MRKNEAAALARLAEDVDFIYAKADGRHSRVGITNDDIIECVISDIQRVATGKAPAEVARLIERYRSETTQPACGDAGVLRVGSTRKAGTVVTSGGVELTAEVEAGLVAEAEAGYNPDQLRPRRRGRDAAVHNTTDLLPPGWRMHRPRWHPAGADPLDCRDCYPQGVSAEQAQQVIDAGGSVRRNDRYRATSRYFVDSLGDGDGTEPGTLYDESPAPLHERVQGDAGRTNPPSDAGPDPAWLAERQRGAREVEREVSENPGPIVRDREIVGELVHVDVCQANHGGRCNCLVGAPHKPRRRAR